jgi:hypothetical protein
MNINRYTGIKIVYYTAKNQKRVSSMVACKDSNLMDPGSDPGEC